MKSEGSMGPDGPADGSGGRKSANGTASASRSDSLAEVRAFVAVVECGSFSQAATRLGLSQPTISQRVQALEQRCMLKLLERRNGVSLTSAGRILFNRARILLGRAEEFDLAVRDIAELRAGRLAIGFSTPRFAMDLARRFVARHPAVDVTFRVGNTRTLLEALAACTIDVAVLTLAAPRPGFAGVELARQRLAVCVAADHPLATRSSVTFADLAPLVVVVREEGSQTREMFETYREAKGGSCARSIEVPTREAVVEAAAAGLGVGIVLDREIGPDPRVVDVPIADCDGDIGTFAVCLDDARGLPAIAAFVEMCREREGGTGGDEPHD